MISQNRTNLLLFVILLPLFFSCANEENNSANTKAVSQNSSLQKKSTIKFDKEVMDLGELQEGEVVECVFHYKNTGKYPLRILSVDPDCGCTNAEFDTDILMPGKKGKIKTVFNSSGFFNNIYKTIEVETDAEPQYTDLKIIAFIHKKNY